MNQSVAVRPVNAGLTAATFGVAALGIVALTQAAVAQVPSEGLALNALLAGTHRYVQQPLADAVPTAMAWSLALAIAAFTAAAVVGVVAGALCSLSPVRIVRLVMWSVGTLGVALPSFFWAMLFQLAIIVIYARTGVRPFPTTGSGLDEHMIGPTIALAARPFAYVLRATAIALDQERHADYTRLARGKGLSEIAIVMRHLLPNVAPTVMSALATAARLTVSSLVIVEFFFNWPGAGSAFIEAIAARRIDLAAAIALAFVTVLALVGRLARLWPSRHQVEARG